MLARAAEDGFVEDGSAEEMDEWGRLRPLAGMVTWTFADSVMPVEVRAGEGCVPDLRCSASRA